MEGWLGSSLTVFVGVTGILTGFAAFMTGQAVAGTWKPYWQVVIYCALLGAAARFLGFALFQGVLWSLTGYLSSAAVLLLIGTASFRLTRARKMVCQYPWVYERSGLFTWRERHPDGSGGELTRT
ncbi:MAG: hypothetical protein IPK66_11435 [Rhodospirillales bacterium]|nr:hypothetical protein [Rhodospirillales bacterium]